MQKTDLQFVTDVVRAAATLMDRTGGFEVRDKGARENIVTSSDLKPSLVIGANCHASARRVLDTVRKHLPALPY